MYYVKVQAEIDQIWVVYLACQDPGVKWITLRSFIHKELALEFADQLTDLKVFVRD